MSADRNYRAYLKRYHGSENEADVVKSLATAVNPARDGEADMRRKLSAKIGQAEEKEHGTYEDEDTGQRRKPVPESAAVFHNQLVEAAYQAHHNKELDAEPV